MGAAHRVPGAAQDRAEARTGQEERAGDREQDAEDRRAGRAEAERHERLEPVADETAVRRAERQHHPCECDAEAEPEGAHVDERALGDHQRADRYQDDGRQVGGRTDGRLDEVRDRAAVEPEPEDGREEDAAGGQAEADELGVVVRVRPRLLLAAALPDAAGRSRGRLVGPLLAHHARVLRGGVRQSCRAYDAVSIPK